MIKNESNTLCYIGHDRIQTQYVFAESNQVYLRKNELQNTGEWFPINFEWISDIEIKNFLKPTSPKEK